MDDLKDRIAGLSPAKRSLLELRLKEKCLATLVNQTIPRRSNNGTGPPSFAQQRLWFLDQLETGSSFYSIPRAVRLRGLLLVDALQKALDAIVARHETLRTNIVTVDGEPIQVIAENKSVGLTITDLSKLPKPDRQTEMQHLLNSEVQRPFNLATDLMLRARLLRLDEKDHVLLLVMHHIASDGWSMGILYQELAALYRAFSDGRPSPLSPLPIQYADFAVWQRQWLQGDVLATQLSYWKKQLSGIPILELPTDLPRPTFQTFRGGRQSLVLPKALSDDLKALSRREGVTLFMTLLAAFQTLLYRYTGQEDIVVGSPIAGRTRPEIEGLIGFFVNTLVLRMDLSESPSFRQFLAQARKVTLEAYEHQDVPFERLVEELHPDRNLSSTPLFQVMFVLQNARSSLKLPGLSVSLVKTTSGTAKFDLTLSMAESADSLTASLEYRTDLFEATTINRMLENLHALLRGIVADPDQRLFELPILSQPERHQLLVEWNDSQRRYPADKSIHELFEAQVKRSPNAVAVVFEDKELTYRALNSRANQLAHYLRRLGVGPEVLVGLYMERSLDMIVALLGILKAGGAYVPLDLHYPKERLSFMLQDSQVPVLLTHRQLLEGIPEFHGKVVCLDTNWDSISREYENNPVTNVRAENLAYVIYTSGSTGKPKGVTVPHRAVNRLLINTNYVDLTPTDVIAQISNCSFDAATFEIWGALLHGARLVVIATDVAVSPKEFAKQLEQKKISALFLTTALFNQMADQVPVAFKHARCLLFGGEAVDPKWAAEVLKQGPPNRLVHVYGPTETTTFATWHLVESVPQGAKTIPIGHPIANTQIFLLDGHLQPVPIGVVGELYIGGDGLARGYLNRPELTAEKFISNPFSDDPKARLYKTGDLARYLADGNIEFIGRKDNQVKIRGFRVEPGEIEAVLGQHPMVQQAIVVAREDSPGEKRLVAYVVPYPPETATAGDLRSFLKTKLPEYMLPSAFVFLDALPLNPNGKVDRKALPVPDKTRSEPQESFVAPRNSVERQLAQIWEKLLGIQPIGVKENFFDLGGHSLLAVRLIAQMEKSFGKNLSLASLFKAPTIEQLAGLLGNQDSSAWSWLVPFQTRGSKPPFFCIHGGGEPLAKLLGTDQPLYGLQPHGQDGRRAPCRVEDMAADYVKEIRMVQPEGPYYMGGYSFGGMVAFEVAQQLKRQGQKVALLALLDPTKPAYREAPALSPNSSQPLPHMTLLREVAQHLRNLAALGLREKLAYLWERVIWRFEAIKRNLKTMVCKFYLNTGRRVPFNLRMFYFFQISYQAAREYTPQLYTGSTILFRTQRPSYDPQWDWPKLTAGKLPIYEIPGKHLDILKEPYVQVLANHLKEYLGSAQQTGLAI